MLPDAVRVVQEILVVDMFGAVSLVVADIFGADTLFDKTSMAIIVFAVVSPEIVMVPFTSKLLLIVPFVAVKLLQDTLS